MSRPPLSVCLLEPYDTGSHHAWLTGYARHSSHAVQSLTLKGAFWKWRMHGGGVTLARAYRALPTPPDLLLATDMLDLTTFLALTRDLTARLPVALYMHENQLTYPARPGEKRDLHYGFINYASMLCCRRILFNSQYHLDSWFDALPRLLKHFPDYNELGTIGELRARAGVLPLGLELTPLDALRPAAARSGPPLILWNHRWEYDKNPGDFFAALYTLAERGVDFQLAVLGEHFVRVPEEFAVAQARLGERVVQFGYAESYADYARWLWLADIVVSTAIHEFFGAAVVEALYCDCFPILPERLTYPQFIPEALRGRCLYRTQEELVARLAAALIEIEQTRATSLRAVAARYDWAALAPQYDRALAEMVS